MDSTIRAPPCLSPRPSASHPGPDAEHHLQELADTESRSDGFVCLSCWPSTLKSTWCCIGHAPARLSMSKWTTRTCSTGYAMLRAGWPNCTRLRFSCRAPSAWRRRSRAPRSGRASSVDTARTCSSPLSGWPGWWATAGSSIRAAPVPIHKDFHAGHLLRDDCVGFIDLDEARRRPRFRPGALLRVSGVRRRREWRPIEAFLDEYALLTGWSDDGSLAWYSAYTWLKIAKQIALRSGPSRTLAADSGWQVGDAVARGLACLAR